MPNDIPKQHVYESARELLAAGLPDEAATHLRRALERDESAGELWQLLGIVEQSRQQIDRAIEALEQATLCSPMSPWAQITLAECYLNRGYRESAAAIYLHLARCQDLASELLQRLAQGLERIGALEEAVSVCCRAATLLPERCEPLLGVVSYMRKLRRPVNEILPHLYELHRRDPLNADFRVSLAWALHECNRSEEGAHLIESLPVQEFECVRCLMLVQAIFQAVDDRDNEMLCRDRLEMLAVNRRIENPKGDDF